MRHFKYKNLTELQAAAEQRGASHVQFEPDAARVREILARPVPVAGLTVGNSLAIHPMEGCDGELDGRPGNLTWRRYERFATGGAKLIWFEATAVREDGRANTRQLWITPENADEYARLLERILTLHRERFGTTDDLLVPIQLTHSGRYAVGKRTIAFHNPYLDEKTGIPTDYPVISDGELERLEDEFVAAAKLAAGAGFRAFDVKVTHGYLLSELSGATTREGPYGGPLENRFRFARNLLGKLRATLGKDAILCMRLGCFDSVPYYRDEKTGIGVPCNFTTPYPYGFAVNRDNPLEPDLAEAAAAVGLVKEAGVQVLNVSLGCPYYNPHVGRPFERPDDGNYEQPEHPLAGVDRHFRVAGALQAAYPDLPMVGTGYSWLQKYAINAGAWNVDQGHIRFVGVGRGVLAYPDFAVDALTKGELEELRVCKTLTYCTFLMRQKNHPLGQFPTGCPPFDKEIYGEIMKQARAAQRSGAQ
ncbi:MAG: NADH:flavin oxidoreductase [Bryobacterales bacterium]|nr:NADH:flavin oxidoreductase [Bryobacterales bacterium]